MKRWWMPSVVAVVWVALAVPGAAQRASELRVGHWVRLKGELDAHGEFRASAAEVLAPGEEHALTGTVTEMLSPTRFRVLGQEVHFSATTRWRGLAAGDLVGARVKVEGDYHTSRKLSADAISRRDPGRDAIEGRIDALETVDGTLRLRVLRWTVSVPAELELAVELPLAELPLAPEREFNETPTDTRDDDDDVRGTLRWGDFVLGGQLEYKHDAIREQDLNDARDDARDDREASLRLELLWQIDESLFALGSVRVRDGRRIDQNDTDEHDTAAILNEGYLYWRDALSSGFDLQAGRQDFDERREWLYDQNLDALRLFATRPAARLEVSVSSNVSDAGRRDEHTTNWLAYVSNNDLDRQLAAYVLLRDSSNGAFAFDDDLQPVWATHIGARAFGEWLPNNDSWLELAYLVGETDEFDDTLNVTTRRDVGAFAFDLGTTWQPWDDGPRFSAGFALGSGGGDARDTFRQSGLHDNTDKFGGETSFQYYGELFDPELSNMSIATLGVGQEVARDTSLDLVGHVYSQDQAVARLIDTGLRQRPDGRHRELGSELDLVLGCKALDGWLVEAVVGWFHPGAAFPSADDAWLFRAQLRYSF
ncbi:MAG: hypothetical protein IT454_06670 [Planctomycetes bacterium]|nr:hypothetical protein [Planctomycetota bacterium]